LFSECEVIFDAGTYLSSDTPKISARVYTFGEAWAVIPGTESKFNDIDSPEAVTQVMPPALGENP
jgi:hypothetical protein